VHASNGILWWTVALPTRRHPGCVQNLRWTAHLVYSVWIGPSYYNDGHGGARAGRLLWIRHLRLRQGFRSGVVDYAETYIYIHQLDERSDLAFA